MRLPRVTVRDATGRDAAAMARIKIDTWRAAYRGIVPQALLDALTVEAETARWLDGMREFPATFRVAERDGEVIGYVITGPALDDAKPAGELYAIYVLPEAQGTGAGRALLEQGLEDLRRQDFTEVTLWVLEQNLRTRGFYERHGFVADGGRKPELGTHAVRYRQPL